MTKSSAGRVKSAIKRAPRPRGRVARQPDPMPAFTAPCLATLVDAPPEGDEWIHEIKFDGYRLQARIAGNEVRLLTRGGLDWTKRFPALAKALGTLNADTAVIDGEAVVLMEGGVTSFSDLVASLEAGRSDEMTFVAFDLLYLNGHNLVAAPLIKRKELLEALLARNPDPAHLRFSGHLPGRGSDVLASACKLGLEGIVSKRCDLAYHSGRNGDWLKSKCIQTDEFVIGGYLTSSVDAKAVGALVVGTFERGTFTYAGRVGTGYSHATARQLWKALQPLRVKAPPFATSLTAVQRRGVNWVEPALVVQIAYRAWTGDGLLRHAAFKGLREDKPAAEVRRPVSASKRGGL